MLQSLTLPSLLLSAVAVGAAALAPDPQEDLQQDPQRGKQVGAAPRPSAQEGSQRSGPPLPPAPGDDAPTDEDRAKLAAAFEAMGIRFAPDAGAIGFSARVEVLNELLEYLLTSPQGASHEAMFLTEVSPDGITAAMLALGVSQGTNVEYVPKDPPPTREEVRAGVTTHDVVLPAGGATYLYGAWREASGAPDPATGEFPSETLHFHRMEDLLLDLVRGRTMRRHPWVWLGSRMIQGRGNGGAEVFAATTTGNLVNVAFFSQGDTLVTAALPECTLQTGWRPNVWLLPDRGSEILFIMSTVELDGLPEALRPAVPFVREPVGDAAPR